MVESGGGVLKNMTFPGLLVLVILCNLMGRNFFLFRRRVGKSFLVVEVMETSPPRSPSYCVKV